MFFAKSIRADRPDRLTISETEGKEWNYAKRAWVRVGRKSGKNLPPDRHCRAGSERVAGLKHFRRVT